MRSDVELATRRWKPLVASRWALIDEFDTDGRRFVVAVENAPPTCAARRDLSLREHQVMTQAHLGHIDKVIAYELGLPVKLGGVGEGLDDLRPFDPEDFARALVSG